MTNMQAPSSSSKAWIQGKVIGSASPCSYLIDSGISLILRNCIRVKLAPPQHTYGSPSHNWAAPTLPEKLLPNSLTTMPLPSQAHKALQLFPHLLNYWYLYQQGPQQAPSSLHH